MKLKDVCFLERNAVTNPDKILKSRDITLPTKVHIVKAMVFSVVTYRYESWAIKKAECGKIDSLELWCWRRLLRVPWSARRSNRSILREISPEYSLEGLMLKLKLQYFGHLMQRANSLEKTLMLGRLKKRGEGGDRRLDGWMASLIQWTWVWANSGLYWRTGKPGVLQSMGSQRVRHDWETEQQWEPHKSWYISNQMMSWIVYEVIGKPRLYELPIWVVANIQKHYKQRMP